MKRHIPNILTLFNLAAGFGAIICISSGNIRFAILLVAIAMVFDFADGFAARLFDAYSPLGKELDSLADMVTFGVVPGFIAFQLIASSMTGIAWAPEWLPWVSVIIPLFSALRLAKFNIDADQTHFFRGLPTPANAFMILSLAIISEWGTNAAAESLASSPFILTLIVILSSIIMVTRIPLLSLKVREYSFRANRGRILLLLMWITLVAILGINGFVFVIPAYIVISLVVGSE